MEFKGKIEYLISSYPNAKEALYIFYILFIFVDSIYILNNNNIIVRFYWQYIEMNTWDINS